MPWNESVIIIDSCSLKKLPYIQLKRHKAAFISETIAVLAIFVVICLPLFHHARKRSGITLDGLVHL